MMLQEKIKVLSAKYLNDIIAVRRHMHSHPELSFKEFETVKYVSSMLMEFGIESQKKIANTGIVATIKGKNPEKATFALRADMDALPILEKNDVPYKSLNEGVMHACGHDAHTSSLLGTARILNELKEEWEGTVRLLFQPGEERTPGGAIHMIREGALKDPKPQGILGQHVMPQLEVGKIGFREGKYMASCDEIYLRIIGKGGHGAMPELAIDPVAIAAQVLVGLQQVISRKASPKTPTVLSFGRIIGEGSTNVIPDEVYIEGTFRAFDESWREKAHELIRQMTVSMVEGMGATCDLKIVKGYPYLENDPSLTQYTREIAESYVGKENVVDLDLWLGGEDFAYYSHEIPACFYRLGTGNSERGITSPVHTPTFNIDEDSLEVGMGLMAWLAISSLQDGKFLDK